ncbi:hypothetical protein CF95_gp061 [Erwinia phage PhiEaH1]|uniref:Uncharacterized protein n=1 Tax=Erwinia phage PhiEaH1 TaxID=1401669 RepID=W8D0G3_9CAUD|nr:hypothetical protein CF95_gp061 [Erwinia phage PhiEaH1]AGX01783.1 hypothetical protein [Erwinia phage PhiEaH1]
MLHANYGIVIPIIVPHSVRDMAKGETQYLTHRNIPENTFVLRGSYVEFAPQNYEDALVLVSKVVTETSGDATLDELHAWAMKVLTWVVTRRNDKGWEKP